jgi:hypothetical protein
MSVAVKNVMRDASALTVKAAQRIRQAVPAQRRVHIPPFFVVGDEPGYIHHMDLQNMSEGQRTGTHEGAHVLPASVIVPQAMPAAAAAAADETNSAGHKIESSGSAAPARACQAQRWGGKASGVILAGAAPSQWRTKAALCA